MRTGFVALIVASMAVSVGAQGAFLYPWPATPTVSDPLDTGLNPSTDIRGAWYATDGVYRYFRLDLEAPVTNTTNGSAMVYGIYIDSKPGGGQNDAIVNYIPASLSGIDFIADSHLDPDGYFRHDYHIYSPSYGGFYVYVEPYSHQQTENGGRTLEWQVPIFEGDMGNQFTFWAASMDLGNPTTTYDITGEFQVPEPAGFVLSLLAAAAALRRRR